MQDALIKAAERRPDTVLTDIALPDGDGEAMTFAPTCHRLSGS